MHFAEIDAFDVTRAGLEWPWVAFAASGRLIAYASSPRAVTTRRLDGERVSEGPSFALPDDLTLEGPAPGLVAFAIAERGLLAVAGRTTVITTRADLGVEKRVNLDEVLGAGHELRALAFDRSERRLWISTETATETVIALLDANTLALLDAKRSAALPRPALHELQLHPQDDAVLLLAACGEAGTFARIVGYAGDVVSALSTALDDGGIAAGFVGFSADGARLHLAEADELRTHAWPTLYELSSVPFHDDFVSSYSGAVLGSDVLVDGQDVEADADALMVFDRSAIRGSLVRAQAPAGMWAGRLGSEAIVTIASKGDPVRARVLVRSGTATPLAS